MLYRHQDYQFHQKSTHRRPPSTSLARRSKPVEKARAANQESQEPTGLTEILLPAHHSLDIILPSIAFLSRNENKSLDKQRWLTWLAPKGLNKDVLAKYGFDLSRVRFIHPKTGQLCVELFSKALAEGNSHTVVASPGALNDKQLALLEQACARGQCSGLILRQRAG